MIQYDSTRQESQTAKKRFTQFIACYQETILSERIASMDLDLSYFQPVQTQLQDIAPKERKTGSILGMILPYIVIILIFIGAMNSAIDITAGEKERGTLATLLVSQINRFEIVLGKYFTVMTISSISMVLGLIGLGIAFLTPAYALGELEVLSIRFSWSLFLLFFLTLAPLVGLASAILLLIGIFARNNKEASTYVTPIYMGAIFLGMISLSQGMTLANPFFLIPILNSSLTFKELLMGTVDCTHIFYTLGSNILIAFVALKLAVSLFSKESVLFRS